MVSLKSDLSGDWLHLMAIYLVMYALDQVCTHGYMNTENFHWFYNAVHGHVASYVKTFSLDNFISFLEMRTFIYVLKFLGFTLGESLIDSDVIALAICKQRVCW